MDFLLYAERIALLRWLFWRQINTKARAQEVAQFAQFIDVLHVHCLGAADPEAALKAALAGISTRWRREALVAAQSGANPWRAIAAVTQAELVQESCLILNVGWQSSLRHGASLAPMLSHVRTLFRDRIETEALVREETASLVLSARLLTGLPLLSLPLGALIGANPLQWLVSSPIGRVVLFIGLTLNGASWLVTRRILRRATRRNTQSETVATCAAAFASLAAGPDAQVLQLAMAVRDIASLDTTGTLRAVASALDLGTPIQQAWRHAATDNAWVPMCEALSHMTSTGVLLPDLLAMVSRDAAQQVRAQVRERVRSAAVLILIPTGLLALPAFMLLTVVPLVAAHFAHVPWLSSQ